MYCTSLLRSTAAILFINSVASQTVPGFTPALSNHLTVTYGTSDINPAGITVPAAGEKSNSNDNSLLLTTNSLLGLTQTPSLGLASAVASQEYAVIMLDLSVQAGPNNTNTTLLHWILPGLIAPSGATTLTSYQSAIAPYFPPGPPAGQTHTYTLLLYKMFGPLKIPADYIPFFSNLTASVYNRIGFNLTKFVDETHLGDLVAADWFLVSTPVSTNSSVSAAPRMTNTTINGSYTTGRATLAATTASASTASLSGAITSATSNVGNNVGKLQDLVTIGAILTATLAIFGF